MDQRRKTIRYSLGAVSVASFLGLVGVVAWEDTGKKTEASVAAPAAAVSAPPASIPSYQVPEVGRRERRYRLPQDGSTQQTPSQSQVVPQQSQSVPQQQAAPNTHTRSRAS